MNDERKRLLGDGTLVSKSRRLLLFVFLVLAGALAAIALFGAMHWERINGAMVDRFYAGSLAGSWELVKKDAGSRLWAFSKLMAVDDRLLPLFAAGRRDLLQAAVAPWFQTLHGTRQLVRLDFIGGDRRVFLRASMPAEFGDLADSALLRQAEKSREATTGLVAGRDGLEFDLVVPLLQKGRIVGYLALGVDVESVLKDLKEVTQADFLVLLRKDMPNFWGAAGRAGWLAAEWDRFDAVVVAAASRPGLVQGLAPAVSDGTGDTVAAPRRLRVISVDLLDTAGSPIGRLDALVDDGERHRVARIALMTLALAVAAATGLAAGIGYLLLYRVLPAVYLSGRERLNLERMSMRDGLTGLYNRSALDDLLHKELAHAHESNLPLSVMVVMVDDYRQGDGQKDRRLEDKVAVAVADTLQHQLRLGDVAVRQSAGGFVLIIQRVGGMLARDVAERLRRAIGNTKIEATEGLVAVSACVGVGCYPEHAKAPGDLLRAAERALTLAKGQGRGQVRVADTVMG